MFEKLSSTNSYPQISSTTNPFVEHENNSNQVQKRFTMNIQQPISIDSVDSTQDQNDGYDLISDDSIQNDSKDDLDHNKERIIYSREQLIDVLQSLDVDYCPDWIKNNLNFPKRSAFPSDQPSINYVYKLIDYEFAGDMSAWNRQSVKPRKLTTETRSGNGNGNNINVIKKKELGNEEEKTEQFEQPLNTNSGLRLNITRIGQENVNNRDFVNNNTNNSNFNSNSHYNNYQSNNFKNNNLNGNQNSSSKYNERQPMFNSNRNNSNNINENRMMDDRNDGRGFLRSRGENLNQNFQSFRRFPNRNNATDHRLNNHSNFSNQNRHHQDHQPEWFTEGPMSQHDTIELKGFDEEEKLNTNKNSGLTINQQQQQHQSPVHRPPSQQDKLSPPINQQQHNQFRLNLVANQPQSTEQQPKADFDISEFENIDWQNVDSEHNVDKVTIENQANSSRFARWFNEPHHNQHTPINHTNEDQIEKLFSNACQNLINQNTVHTVHPPQPQHFNQQQIDLQNNFFGNLMNRNQNHNLPQNLHHQSQPQLHHQQQQQQQKINNRTIHHQREQLENDDLMNASNKTDQQLFNILQKARINMNSLMVQQNVLNKENIIKGQVKSAEELEANLLSNNGGSINVENVNKLHSIDQSPHHQSHHQQSNQIVNPADLFQKLCLVNSINKHEIVDVHQSNDVKLDDNCAINPFVLNLLDDAQKQKQKNIAAVSNTMNIIHQNKNMFINNANRSNNYLQNMIFNNANQPIEKREEKVNPFMPTSVIRKIAKEKNSIGAIGNNRGLSETNFEIVTGNHLSERSILANRAKQIELEQFANSQQQKGILNNYTMNQANLMAQNFAIATGNRWNDNSILQQHSIDSTTPHQTDNSIQQQQNADALRNILMKASKKHVDPNTLFNSNFASSIPQQVNANQQIQQQQQQQQHPKIQNDNQKKLIEILQKASKNFDGKAPADVGNKINNWFELELKRNNDHLSPIIKENAFTLEDIENN